MQCGQQEQQPDIRSGSATVANADAVGPKKKEKKREHACPDIDPREDENKNGGRNGQRSRPSTFERTRFRGNPGARECGPLGRDGKKIEPNPR